MNEPENTPYGAPLTPQTTPQQQQTAGQKAQDTIEDIASTLRDLFTRVPENVGKAIERAINVRDTTVLIRLSDSASDSLDTLVSAGIFKGRSEAAAFLIDEGIKSQSALFQRIQDKLNEIERLRAELRTTVSPDMPQ